MNHGIELRVPDLRANINAEGQQNTPPSMVVITPHFQTYSTSSRDREFADVSEEFEHDHGWPIRHGRNNSNYEIRNVHY
jgi:hypothetical protein